MQPDQAPQPEQVTQPAPFAPPVEASPAPAVNNRKRTTLAIWLMVGPTALLIASLILYAVVNFAVSTTTGGNGDDLFGQQSWIQTTANVALFLVGAISILTWLPGLIIGIVLLATKKK